MAAGWEPRAGAAAKAAEEAGARAGKAEGRAEARAATRARAGRGGAEEAEKAMLLLATFLRWGHKSANHARGPVQRCWKCLLLVVLFACADFCGLWFVDIFCPERKYV